jgi:hypothetical protein
MRHALGRVSDRALATLDAVFVPMRRIGFLIVAESTDARPANCEPIYDFAASKSQIEFGEAAIMETNELITRPARKLHAPRPA